MSVFADRLEKALEFQRQKPGSIIGFQPDDDHIWVGEGPQDPERYVFTLPAGSVRRGLRGVAGLARFVEGCS